MQINAMDYNLKNYVYWQQQNAKKIEPKEGKPKKRTKDMVCGNDYCELE